MKEVQIIEIEEGKDIIFTVGGSAVAVIEIEPARDISDGTYRKYEFVGHGINVGRFHWRKFIGGFAAGNSLNFESADADFVKLELESVVAHQ